MKLALFLSCISLAAYCVFLMTAGVCGAEGD